MTQEKIWNIGPGLGNVAWSLLDKANYAGWQLEDKSRAILNIDSYEDTVLIYALSEYIEKHNLKKVNNEN